MPALNTQIVPDIAPSPSWLGLFTPLDHAQTSPQSGPSRTMSQSSPSSGVEFKRKKARRACDHCREKRLRCEYAGQQLSCSNCQRHQQLCRALQPPPADDRPRKKRDRRRRPPKAGDTAGTGDERPLKAVEDDERSQGLEPRFLGSTSLTGLTALGWSLLSTPDGEGLESIDDQYSHFRVQMQASGEEVVLIARGKTDQDDGSQLETSDGDFSAENLALNLKGGKLAATAGSESVLLALMHSYRLNFLPICSILSLSELCSLEPGLSYAFASTDMGPPPPTPLHRVFGKLAVCTLAALSRDVPRQIFFSLLHTLCSRLDGEEGTQLLRTSSLGNVQVLLLLALNSELQAVTTSRGGSLSWLTVGLAVRMAQDIGLHRDITSNHVAQQQVNRRRRVWAACVIADRWYALSFGQPMTINLFDCDARGPSIFPDACADGLNETEKPFQLHAEITKLSILLGRVLRYAYSPLGLDMVTNSTLYQLQEDFDQWRSELPPSLRFSPDPPDPRAGLLGLLSACVEFVFLRAFLRPKKPIPTRISYRPSVDAWQDVVKRSEHAIRWIAAGGSFFMDTWFIVMYSHMWCFFVQLHAYVATGDDQALGLMQTANDSISQWAQRMKSVSNQAALRTKVASLANTLTVAALSSHQRRGAQGVAQMTELPLVPVPETHNVSFSSSDPDPNPDPHPGLENQSANMFDEIFPPTDDTLAPDMQLLELFLHDPQMGWAFQPDGVNVEPAVQNFDDIDRFYMLE